MEQRLVRSCWAMIDRLSGGQTIHQMAYVWALESEDLAATLATASDSAIRGHSTAAQQGFVHRRRSPYRALASSARNRRVTGEV